MTGGMHRGGRGASVLDGGPLTPSLTHPGWVRVVMLLGPYSAGLPSGWSEFADQSSHGSSWFACLHLLTRVCSCSYMSVCIGTHMCMCPHVSAGSHGREHSGAHMHLCVSTCVPACTCVYRHMCRCMCSCVCTWALTHAHACSPACVHMPHVNRTHVCTCVCVCVCVWYQRILSSFTQGTCWADSETPVSPACWTRAVSNKKHICFGHLLRRETWIREAMGSWGREALPRETEAARQAWGWRSPCLPTPCLPSVLPAGGREPGMDEPL